MVYLIRTPLSGGEDDAARGMFMIIIDTIIHNNTQIYTIILNMHTNDAYTPIYAGPAAEAHRQPRGGGVAHAQNVPSSFGQGEWVGDSQISRFPDS
jgi:hypothetical protein